MTKDLKKEIRDLKKLIKHKDNEIELLQHDIRVYKDNEKFIKEHAQKAGTETYQWKKKCLLLENEVEDLKYKIDLEKNRKVKK